MRIKNTKELRLRARAHAKADHIQQGTYGSGTTNGKTEYEGCAVGCLATPHRLKDLREYIIKHGHAWDGENYEADFDGEWQRQKVAKEFGITERLMILAEGFFETQEYHGGAIEFVKNFATSLNEGADITPRMVDSWAEENLGSRINSFTYVETCLYYKSIEEMTAKFLSWVKSIKA